MNVMVIQQDTELDRRVFNFWFDASSCDYAHMRLTSYQLQRRESTRKRKYETVESFHSLYGPSSCQIAAADVVVPEEVITSARRQICDAVMAAKFYHPSALPPR